MKTYNAKPEDVKARWYALDANGQILGRLAGRIARILTGKGKTLYTPYVESGDYVVVTNASHIRVTGKKLQDKIYDHYTGYPGGRKAYTLEELLARRPDEVLRRAVKGMLPKNRLGDRMLTHLLIYSGSEHKQQAQRPEVITL
ncbi:MAG: 50S ribosomal protein L13 [Omnitrophica bacterium GWA2_50_21]|nr:MAG: 50S ribosomal protein L13 [Omnitrophica bacterium GWA2_50_21]